MFIMNFKEIHSNTEFLSTYRRGDHRSRSEERRVKYAVIDTWENEPDIHPDLLQKVFLGTPHIAGYSADGKSNATREVFTIKGFRCKPAKKSASARWNVLYFPDRKSVV